MRDWIFALITLILCLLVIKVLMMDVRLRNVERATLRIERSYDTVYAENEKLIRMNNQTLRLMTEGGWDGLTD